MVRDSIDPELLAFAESFPSTAMSLENIAEVRKTFAVMDTLGDPASRGVIRREFSIETSASCQKAYLYKPEKVDEPIPAFLAFHGGGYVVGSPRQLDIRSIALASKLGIAVLCPSYRLAPEHPFPAALDDACAATEWLFENSTAQGIDAKRIAVGGDSAGGGLTAALTLYNRDHAKYPIAHQQLVYPMLDDRTTNEGAEISPAVFEETWSRHNNRFAWNSYLAGSEPSAPAVPARAADLSGLPPAWIATATLDLFRDENIAYAQRLIAAGVPVELQVYPAAIHGFLLAKAAVAKRFFRDYCNALARALDIDQAIDA